MGIPWEIVKDLCWIRQSKSKKVGLPGLRLGFA